MDPLSIAYARLQAVPQRQWDALVQKKIYFGHQSVGQNVIDGLREVLKRFPAIRLNIRETSNPDDFDGPLFAHSLIGTNRDPKGKIDQFRTLLDAGIGQKADVALFKFCYVDIDQTTRVQDLIEDYDLALGDLSARYPKLVILPVTAPLTSAAPGLKARIKRLLGRGPALKADNILRNLFNAHIREHYGAAIWDLADAETTDAQGGKTTFRDGQETFFLLDPAYTSDGGHLSVLGSQIAAISLLLCLASAAR
jgi:hypothetical protein